MADQEQPVLIHLHLSDNGPVTEEEMEFADGSKATVLWKDVLREGEYPMSPGPGGATEEPMRVIAEGTSDPKTKTIAMSDLLFAHEDGAFKYVTIPTTHRDGVLDNTGYVPRPKGVRVVEKDGAKVFQAALGFTEPDIKGKVARGTIPDVSGGIFFGWRNKATKKVYPAAMKHVALTPTPFMQNLDPFKPVFASDDYSDVPDDTKVEVYEFADGDTSTGSEGAVSDNTANTAEIVWNEKDGGNWLRQQLEESLTPERDSAIEDGRPYQPRPSYYVQDVSQGKKLGLVTEYFKGDSTRYVVPFEVGDDGVKPAPSTRWVEVREAMIAASDDSTDDFMELSVDTLQEKLGLALSEQTGPSESRYRIDTVSLDNRARIVNRAKGKAWIANFAILPDGGVWLEDSEKWKSVDLTTGSGNTPSNGNVAQFSDDTLSKRVRDARKRRAALLSSSTS